MIDSRQYELNDQNVMSELLTRLKSDEFKEDIPHNKYKHDSVYEMNSKTNASIKSSTEYIDMCKNQCLMRSFQSGSNNTDKNSDIAKANLIKNIEYVKKQPEIRKYKNIHTRLVNEIKSQSCSVAVSMKYKMYISLSKYHRDEIFFFKYTFLIISMTKLWFFYLY